MIDCEYFQGEFVDDLTDVQVKEVLSSVEVLALTLWGEARGESIPGIVGVANVIRNRVKHPQRFGRTYRAVCHARRQFSCWAPLDGPANYAAVMGLARRVLAGEDPAELVPCRLVAEGILGGTLGDNTGGATHYYNPRGVTSTPAWARGKTPSARIGHHLFFAGIA